MKHTKPFAYCVLATVMLMLVAGCTTSVPVAAPTTSTPPVSMPPVAISATPLAAPSTTPPSIQPNGVVRTGNTIDVTKVGDVAFATPSGNIFCYLYAGSAEFPTGTVRCDIQTFTFAPPPQPASCLSDWGQSLHLGTTAGFGCISDAIPYEALITSSQTTSWWDRLADGTATTYAGVSAALPYGKTIISGDLRCTSTHAGLTCQNTRTHARFLLSRDKYTLSN